ncbi:transcriptional regulator [Marinobacterium nitratireducens]|uniref:Transcriptional regulator n=1 Tax=Marinobacterium nitratireducens TaxID=518897 RepID=A0A918DQL6_9GAMM|nr:class I SAM-dependent methyltransferase [Marinobacterium nitratireducens]GGO77530.1 transcriptional regulator [Marinobacterium nitratireducens]
MCRLCTQALPEEAFAEKLLETVNAAALNQMLSLGHRSGLFDCLAGMKPATSAAIAARAGLNERYVREWLGAMVVSGILLYDPDDECYQLPDSHAAFLTRAASPNNLAVMAQFMPMLGSVENRVLECFRNGGGLRYDEYPGFHRVMAEDSGQSVVSCLFSHILPLVDGLEGRLQRGIEVLDLGCGSGRALLAMAQRYPASRFVGLDFSAEAVGNARREATRLRLENIDFEVRDVARLDDRERFGLITAFDAIHDQAEPARVLSAAARALHPEGIFLMVDIAASSRLEDNIGHPLAPTLYAISCMHCMSVSLGQGGPGLGTVWGRELAQQMLREAGFRHTKVHRLEHDIQNYYYVNRKA